MSALTRRRFVGPGNPDDLALLQMGDQPAVVPAPAVCPTCLGETTVVVEQRGADVTAPCPGCACEVCGTTTDTPPMCVGCDAADDTAYRRRYDR